MRQHLNLGPVSLLAAVCMFVGASSATARLNWRVTLTDGEAGGVELMGVSGDSLTIGRDGMTQNVAISSLVQLRRGGSAGAAIGAGVGGGLGLVLGAVWNSFRRGNWEWSTDGATLFGFASVLGTIGAVIGEAASSNATYNLERLDPAERRELLIRLTSVGR